MDIERIIYKIHVSIYNIKYWPTYIATGIHNIKVFWHAVWNFRGWDYSFTLQILQIAIQEQRNTLVGAGIIVQEEEDKQKETLDRALEILKLMTNEEYTLMDKDDAYLKAIKYKEAKKNGNDYYINNRKVEREFAWVLVQTHEWNELWTIIKNHMQEWWN